MSSAAVAGDLAPPTIDKKADSCVVTFHVERPQDIGQRFHDHVDLARAALGSTSSTVSTARPRPDGFDVTFENFK